MLGREERSVVVVVALLVSACGAGSTSAGSPGVGSTAESQTPEQACTLSPQLPKELVAAASSGQSRVLAVRAALVQRLEAALRRVTDDLEVKQADQWTRFEHGHELWSKSDCDDAGECLPRPVLNPASMTLDVTFGLRAAILDFGAIPVFGFCVGDVAIYPLEHGPPCTRTGECAYQPKPGPVQQVAHQVLRCAQSVANPCPVSH